MATRSPARVVLMFVAFSAFLMAITFNSLSAFGAKSVVFKYSTEDVILKYTTPITPAQWALFVWDFIYFWVLAMFLYFLTALCRRNAYDWMYTTPAVLPYGFHVSIITNICLNITWQFLFDRELLLPGLITSALMLLTDYMILFFSCHGLKIYGAWLNKHGKTDLWLIRILDYYTFTGHVLPVAFIRLHFDLYYTSTLPFMLFLFFSYVALEIIIFICKDKILSIGWMLVQNGVAVYATWGTLFTLLNLTIYVQYQAGVSRCDCATLSLLLLLMKLSVWFLLENFYLDEHVRYVVTIYPVVMLWLTGALSNSVSPESHIYIFEAFILALSSVMFVARLGLVAWRHHKRPLYNDSGPSLSPVEIALTQRRLCL